MKNTLLLTLLTASALMAKEVQLLDDHLRMELPDDKYKILRVGGPCTPSGMTAPNVPYTFYTLQNIKEHITVTAEELFQYAEPDFVDRTYDDMKKSAPEEGYEVSCIGDNIVYSFIPPDVAQKNNITAPYGKALVRHADGMVQEIHFCYVSEATHDLPAAREIFLDALSSIKPGEGAPDISARTVTFAKHKSGMALNIPLPQGYAYIRGINKDYTIYVFKEVQPTHSRGGHIQIRIGYLKDRTTPSIEKVTRKGKLLGKDVTWHIQTQTCFPAIVAPYQAALFTQIQEGNGGYAEIIVHAETQEKLDELISVVEAMIWVTVGEDK